MMRHVISPVAATLLVALLSGCGITNRVKPTPSMDALPAVTKSSVHAAVYYSPQFANQEDVRTGGPNTFIVGTGPASVRLFDDLYSRVFEKASRVSNLSPDELTSQGIEVVVAPSLEHFGFRLGWDTDSDRYSVSYRTTLYTIQGVPVASWIVLGNAPSRTMGSIQIWIEDDMKDAATKFLQSFEREAGPALAAIAKVHGSPAVPLDAGNVALTAGRTQLPGLEPKALALLQESGVIPVRVTAQSKAEGELVVRASDMRLRLQDGRVIEPSSVSAVLGILEQTSQTGSAVAAAVGAPLGVLTMFLQDRSKQGERELQFKASGQSLFEDRILKKEKEEAGIVLFRLPKDVKSAEGATLTAWVVDPASARGAHIEVPLSITP
jgi:hypothetical protein